MVVRLLSEAYRAERGEYSNISMQSQHSRGNVARVLTMILRVASRFGNALQGVSYHLTRRTRGLSGCAMGD